MDLKTLHQSDENVVIFPGAVVAGDVSFGPGCSVWFNAVLRGDGQPIIVGRGTNIQDGAVFHSDVAPTVLGEYVTVGHGAIVRVARSLTQEELDGLRPSAEHYMELKEAYR